MSDARDLVIEEDLKTAWYFYREEKFRQNLKDNWSTVDGYTTFLDTGIEPTHGPLRDTYNKPTAVYFEQSAQCGCYDNVRGYPCVSRVFIASIFEAWRARCGDEMDIEFGHFLANPDRITKRGPKNLSEIAVAHQAICEMAKAKAIDKKYENYEILPSYPAVILIFDRTPNGNEPDEDGYYNLRKNAERVTVLVMKTGASMVDDVTLEDLDNYALPLERSDANGIDIRRVPLSIAVDFIVTLENRMRAQEKKKRQRFDSELGPFELPKGFDPIVKSDPQMWAAALMAPSSTEKKTDPWSNVQQAIRRIEARASGIPSGVDFEHVEWMRHWKSGYDEAR
ncbi:hypothetical protein BU24DRAFT_226278 [Aaosphaeria arxii CBS 175.79]|uniref:Uncharacterized protein n=1 Tax=Aaosphaeria arxii CBS 175.79 TaxID=1450172 RepID=A0A6A5XP08_9PLEO|nr:uncharacterized protein BU24DRAFT_226278 [Aaosphaeria arxii CBS 175.79]KAF2014995.1 hypothetical protein BU24DRAFT_226278 [Aaosphaeria arxii CBS 175.79]